MVFHLIVHPYFMFNDLRSIQDRGMISLNGFAYVFKGRLRMMAAEIDVDTARISVDLLPRF